ncbi:Protein of unknown function [Gryllus bimaculatus]|nr:Protein of unknown function [Gryllus bimaculatus]
MRDSPEIRQEESPASSSLENMAVMEVAQASQQPRCTTASVQQREIHSIPRMFKWKRHSSSNSALFEDDIPTKKGFYKCVTYYEKILFSHDFQAPAVFP